MGIYRDLMGHTTNSTGIWMDMKRHDLTLIKHHGDMKFWWDIEAIYTYIYIIIYINIYIHVHFFHSPYDGIFHGPLNVTSYGFNPLDFSWGIGYQLTSDVGVEIG